MFIYLFNNVIIFKISKSSGRSKNIADITYKTSVIYLNKIIKEILKSTNKDIHN